MKTTSSEHEKYMRIALDLAIRGAGKVSPNPMVGAVIVKDDKIIGQGYHSAYGEPHAEIEALKRCPNSAGATLYVTLEPCCHYGKTPPCTDFIIKRKIAKVVVGSKDPNPLVFGKGIKILKENGIEVEKDVLKKECREVNEIFFHYMQKRKPFVVMKYAMTADGKIATSSGESKWITGNSAREHTHRTRNALSGIMVGIGTVLSDDPLLTCRMPGGKNPVRIICDTTLKIPLDSKIVQTAKKVPTIIAASSSNVFFDSSKKEQLENLGITILKTELKDSKLDLQDLMKKLGKLGIDSIFLEGGGTLNYSALQQGIVQKIHIYMGAKIFGGQDSLSPVAGAGIKNISEAVNLKLSKVTEIGGDVLIEYRVKEVKCSQA